MNDKDRSACRFGEFVLDRRRRQLRQSGRAIPVPGKAFDLLSVLVASPGKAFSREELYDLLWPGDIVEDGNLTQNVYLLRRALDADGDGRRFIKTIPRFGYAFVHGVDETQGAQRPVLRPLLDVAVALLIFLTLASSSGIAHARLPQRAAEAEALGEYHLDLRGPNDLEVASRYFRSAIDTAPDDAAGYAGAASALALTAEYRSDGSSAQRGSLAKARVFLHGAFRCDQHDSRALAVAGFISYRFDDDYETARRLLREAIAQDPGNADARLWYGVVLLADGDLHGALHEFETAHAQRPTSEVYSRWLARAYTFAHRADDAIVAANDALRIAPYDAAANFVLASAEEQRGRLREALHVMKSLGARDSYEQPYLIPSEARIRRLMHERARIDSRDRLDPFETALFYVSIGEQRRAFDVLRAVRRTRIERALEAYDPRLARFKIDSPLRQLLGVLPG